jgi:two-component system response regulator YesN
MMVNPRPKLPVPARILLVDDDEIFRSEFREYFQEYGIAEAQGGDEALKILKRPNEIDLVVLDVRMSGMNGIEVLQKIRDLTPQVRIVMLTGYSSKDVVLEALRGQADDYIEKPLDLDAMKEVIEKLLGTKRGDVDRHAVDMEGKIERVKEFVHRNVLRKVTLEDAAAAVSLSPKYLSRIFKQHTGMGFSEYRLGGKIRQAKIFLEKTGYNVDQISDKLGYQNCESFIRQFKKITKFTPTEFRKNHKSAMGGKSRRRRFKNKR